MWGKGQSVPEEIRDLIKLPVWVKAFRCKADLYDNGSLSEFCSTKGSFFLHLITVAVNLASP